MKHLLASLLLLPFAALAAAPGDAAPATAGLSPCRATSRTA